MRRRATPYRATINDSSVSRTVSGETCNERRTAVTTQLSISRDDSGNVYAAVMAEEGVGGPVPLSDELRNSLNDLERVAATNEGRVKETEESSDSSSDESDSSDDSEDNDHGIYPTNAAHGFCGDGPATNAGVPSIPCMSVVPTGGALQTPIQPQTGNIATFGNVSVEASTGIHFGNETIYHGPVIIEQHVYDSDDVTQLDNSLQLSLRDGPLAITDGSKPVGELPLTVQKSKGLELNFGSFKAGAATLSKGRSGLLWRHLLGRRPGCTTWVACIALTLGCIAVLAVIIAVTIVKPSGRSVFASFRGNGHIDSEQQNGTTSQMGSLLEIVPRREWVAQPPKSTTLLKHPVEYVIISHTSTDACVAQPECTLTIRYIQVYHVEGKKFLDISYNFMVAGDGRAYEGRGWDVIGAHTAAGFNSISVGISFVGTFDNELPPPVQIRACKLLIEEGVRLGKISPDYKLIADRQVSASGNPGKKLFDELKTWEHWTADV